MHWIYARTHTKVGFVVSCMFIHIVCLFKIIIQKAAKVVEGVSFTIEALKHMIEFKRAKWNLSRNTSIGMNFSIYTSQVCL